MKIPLALILAGAIVSGDFISHVSAASPATAETQAASANAPFTPPSWPRRVTAEGVTLDIYQPQVESWEGSRLLKARAAFVMTPGKGKPAIGVMEIEGETTTDLATRTVLIRAPKLTAVRFPSVSEAEAPPTEALFRKVFPSRALTVSLDRLVAGVEHAAKPLNLKMDPPQILKSESPGLLLLVEGKPVTAPAGKGEFVVNANWDLFVDPETKAYYLLGGGVWYTAPKLDGEWALTTTLPAFLSSLPEGAQWEHVKKAIPPQVKRGQPVARVFFADQPSELIVFDGSPVWEEVPGIGLSWARNTESRVFRTGKQLYFLTSGRWFRATDWEGPWSYAGNDLPDAFRNIPADSPIADILASVPGTPEAADAIVLASIPREAVVKVKEAESKATATYHGEPEFKKIEGTSMAYATNTSSDVIRVGKEYYLCQNGVWFVAAAAKGPWRICTTVPAVIYTIPPSSPVHRVVYVTTQPGTSADVVVCSYTAGYEGAYVASTGGSAVLVWGTGYYYPPYVAWGGPVPVYYPYPATYGTAAVYHPWTGGYAVGQAYYGPYGSAGSAAWYNPNTGNYGRAARVTTPYGSSTYAAGYNPRTDTAWSTQQNYNGYTQWGTSAVQRGDDWIRTGHAVNENGAIAGWNGSNSSGHVWKTDDHSGGTARHDGDFYAGHDGNVYKRDDDGNWSKYEDGDWNSVDSPERPHSSDAKSKEAQRDQLSSTSSTEGSRRDQLNASEGSRGEEARQNRENREATDAQATRRDDLRETRGDGTASTQGERRRDSLAADGSTREQAVGGENRPERTEQRQPQRNREQTREARPQERPNRGGDTARTRQVPSDLSRQLNRDSANRRAGIERERRSVDQRSRPSRPTRERRR